MRNGCTGITGKGVTAGGFAGVSIDDMQLRERVARPKIMYITASTGGDFLTLFARAAAPNDTNEVRSGDRFMLVSTTALPAPLTSQTVYKAVNATDTTVQPALTVSGDQIDITSVGGSFGEMFIATRLCIVEAASVLRCQAHDLNVGDEVRFDAVAPAPTGIVGSVSLYILTVPDADHFTLSLTPGGSQLSVGLDGSGILSVERQRIVTDDAFSRTGVVWVAAAGFEFGGGGQPSNTLTERTNGLKLNGLSITNCYHPDRMGNQGVGLIVDVASAYTFGLSVQNLGRSDIEASPPGDEHMHGIIHWDNSLIVHNGLTIEGVPSALTFVGGWQRITLNGCTMNGADGQSNPSNAIINGMESAAGSFQPTDVNFNDCTLAGYSAPIAAHQSTWFAATEYSWSRFRFASLHLPGLGDITVTYTKVRCCKNAAAVTLVTGDVVKMASITDVNGYLLPSVVLTTSTEPRGTGVVVYNPLGWAANARCLVAFGDGVATVEAVDTPAPGSLLYSQTSNNKKLTTVSTGASPRGLALAGKISGQVPFQTLIG